MKGELKMRNPILENWSIEYAKDLVSKTAYYRLNGNAYNHPNHPAIIDGEYIYTSPLSSINFAQNQAETVNRIYDLGKPFNGTIISFAGPRAT